jgi:hypothetical protein
MFASVKEQRFLNLLKTVRNKPGLTTTQASKDTKVFLASASKDCRDMIRLGWIFTERKEGNANHLEITGKGKQAEIFLTFFVTNELPEDVKIRKGGII